MTPEILMTTLKVMVVFVAVSFLIFWIGMVWWVSQDVLSRTNDKVITFASVAIAAILGPVGLLLYLIIRPKKTIQESVGEMMEREMMLSAAASTICSQCGRMVHDTFVNCPHCGTKIKEQCVSCQQLVATDWEHCPHCGSHLRPQRSALTSAGSSSQPVEIASSAEATVAIQRRRHQRSTVTRLWRTVQRGAVSGWHWLKQQISRIPSPTKQASVQAAAQQPGADQTAQLEPTPPPASSSLSPRSKTSRTAAKRRTTRAKSR